MLNQNFGAHQPGQTTGRTMLSSTIPGNSRHYKSEILNKKPLLSGKTTDTPCPLRLSYFWVVLAPAEIGALVYFMSIECTTSYIYIYTHLNSRSAHSVSYNFFTFSKDPGHVAVPALPPLPFFARRHVISTQPSFSVFLGLLGDKSRFGKIGWSRAWFPWMNHYWIWHLTPICWESSPNFWGTGAP